MKLCTVARVTGPDNKEHFAVVPVGQNGWPLALCGLTSGKLAKQSEAEAMLFADAPAMQDLLEVLLKEFGNINPGFPLAAGKIALMNELLARAEALIARHP